MYDYWNLGGERLHKVYLGSDLIWSNEPNWGSWSAWSDNPVTANENRQVEEKDLHTYQSYGDYPKKLNKQFQKCTLPNRKDICPHACRYVPAGSFENWWEDHGNGNFYCYGWYWGTEKQWGYNGTVGASSGWVEGVGTTTDTYRVVNRKKQYRYRVNLNA